MKQTKTASRTFIQEIFFYYVSYLTMTVVFLILMHWSHAIDDIGVSVLVDHLPLLFPNSFCMFLSGKQSDQ